MQFSLHGKAAGRVLAIVLLAASSTAFADGGQDTARLCSSGDPRCLEDVAKALGQAITVCNTSDETGGAQGKSKTSPFTADLLGEQPAGPSWWRCAPHAG